jgi:hypothetical protein
MVSAVGVKPPVIVGGVLSSTWIVWITEVALLPGSVIVYVLVMTIGQVPELTSLLVTVS